MIFHHVVQSAVIREFMRLQQLAIVAGEEVVPAPSRSMISSFASYNSLFLRGGAAVGGESLQHIFTTRSSYPHVMQAGANLAADLVVELNSLLCY